MASRPAALMLVARLSPLALIRCSKATPGPPVIRPATASWSSGMPDIAHATEAGSLRSKSCAASGNCAVSLLFFKAPALPAGKPDTSPVRAADAQRALPKMTSASAGPSCRSSVSEILRAIIGISLAGSDSSSTRFTKIMTSRDRTCVINRISARSAEDKA